MTSVKRVVEVRSSKEGSGYLLSSNLILTSWHVIENSDEIASSNPITVRIPYTSNIGNPNSYRELDAYCVWPSKPPSEDFDFALLKVNVDTSDRQKIDIADELEWAKLPEWGVVTVIAAGYPDIAIDRQNNKRDTKSIIGQIIVADNNRALSKNSGTLSIIIHDEYSPSTHPTEAWAAMSGAAVFSGSILVGIIKSVVKTNGRHVFKALPVSRLFEESSLAGELEELDVTLPTRVELNTESSNSTAERDTIENYLSSLSCLETSLYGSFDFPENHKLSDVIVEPTSTLIESHSGAVYRRRKLANILSRLDNTYESSNLIIQGAPGAGKSTLLKYICLNCWHSPRKIGLNKSYLPLYIKLSCLSQATGSDVSEKLWNALALNPEILVQLKASPNFLYRWPKLMSSNWLILLDGFDEVSPNLQSGVQNWIRQLLDLNYRVILTTRPSSSLSNNFKRKFIFYQLEFLSEAGEQQLASRICGDKSEKFLEQWASISIDSVRNTPLMLTIAALVFLTDDKLPVQRVKLYQKFIDIIEAEAIKRGLKREMPSSVDDRISDLIECLAFFTTADNDESTVVELTDIIAQEFGTMSKSSPEFYRAPVAEAIDVIENHVGFYQLIGQSCVWSHATFREFLAARKLSQESHPFVDGVSITKAWQNDKWRQVARFWFSIRSFNYDISEAIEETLSVKDEYNSSIHSYRFISEIIADGAIISDDIANNMVRFLCEYAQKESREHACNRALTQIVGATTTLEAIANLQKRGYGLDRTLKLRTYMKQFIVELGRQEIGQVRKNAFKDLAVLGGYEELFDIGTNMDLDSALQVEALRCIPSNVRTQEVDDALALLLKNNATIKLLGHGSLQSVAEQLCDRGRKHLVFGTLLDQEFSSSAERAVMAGIHSHCSEAELTGFIDSVKLSGEARLTAAYNLCVRTNLQKHCNSLMDLVASGFGDSKQRELAIRQIAHLIGNKRLVDFYLQMECECALASQIARKLLRDHEYSLLMSVICDNALPDKVLADVFQIMHQKDYHLKNMPRLKEWIKSRIKSSINSEIETVIYTEMLSDDGFLNESIELANTLRDSSNWSFWSKKTVIVNLLTLERYDDVLKKSIEYLDQDPEGYWAHGIRASVFKRIGDLNQAKQDCELCLQSLRPQQWQYSLYGQILYEMAQPMEAYSAFESALMLNEDSDTRLKLTHCSIAVCEWNQAISDIELIINEYPDHTDSRTQRAILYGLIDEPESALRDYDSVLDISASDSIAAAGRAMAYLRLSDVEMASDAIDQINDEDSCSDWYLYLKGCYKLILGSEKGAIDLWKEAIDENRKTVVEYPRIESSPNVEQLWQVLESNVGLYYCAIGEYDKGLDSFMSIVEFDRTYFAQKWSLPELWDFIKIAEIGGKDVENAKLVYGKLFDCTRNIAKANQVSKSVNTMSVQSYPCPMYCRLANIKGLEKEAEFTGRLIADVSKIYRSVALIKLPNSTSVFGHCNFKKANDDSSNLKFCEYIETMISQNISQLVESYDVVKFIFTQPEFMKLLESEINKLNLNVECVLA